MHSNGPGIQKESMSRLQLSGQPPSRSLPCCACRSPGVRLTALHCKLQQPKVLCWHVELPTHQAPSPTQGQRTHLNRCGKLCRLALHTRILGGDLSDAAPRSFLQKAAVLKASCNLSDDKVELPRGNAMQPGCPAQPLTLRWHMVYDEAFREAEADGVPVTGEDV